MSDTQAPRSHHHWRFVCCAVTLITIVVAYFELQRVATGNLLIVAMPWEPIASEFERRDAIQSATDYRLTALVALGAIGLVIAATGPLKLTQTGRPHAFAQKTIIVFSVAVLADLFSTVWFFHAQGIDFEFHPAIRLFGYAYGRTIGPIAGKLIQAAGILYVSVLLNERGNVLISLVSAAYLIAAIYNVAQTLAVMG